MSGCIEEPCKYEGVKFYLARDANITFTINESEIDMISNYTASKFFLRIKYDEVKENIWIFDQHDVDKQNNRIKFKPNYQNNYTKENTIFKYEIGHWKSFSFTIVIDTDNDFIKNKTFFNNSNKITGKIIIQNGDDDRKIMNIKLDENFPEIYVHRNERSSEIIIHTSEWSFEILIIICESCR
jgi:hypothetical protein